MLLHGVVFGFSQDLSLGMCLEKQSGVRLAAKFSPPAISSHEFYRTSVVLAGPSNTLGAHLPSPEVGLGVSTHSEGASPNLQGVVWQH